MPDSHGTAPAEGKEEVSPENLFVRRCRADYDLAEITTVAHSSSGAKGQFTHLLAVVELLHRHLERNPLIGLAPGAGGYPRRLPISSRAGTMYVQRWHCPVGEALEWYRACATGSMSVPGAKPGSPTIVDFPAMSADPQWPFTVVEETPFWDGVVRFWGNRPGGSQWHRLVPTAPVEFADGWLPEDWEKARALLRKEIHIDLLSRPVLHGSCHLLLPNPLFSEASVSVTPDWKAVALALKPFPGSDLTSLELTVWNRRAWGGTSVVRHPITFPRTLVPLPEGVEETAHAIVCNTRGLLKITQPAGFIGSVRFSMHMVAEQRTVQVPARSKRHGPEEYTVGVSGPAEESTVGTVRERDVYARLARDEANNEAHALWRELDVRWFHAAAADAQREVRNIIGSAHRSVDILDPYFGANDLLRYALASRIRGVPVRILTSAEYCRGDDSDKRTENGEQLLRTLESIRTQDPNLNIAIKVMRGDKSPIHDRFLITDDTVRVLGASLNEFGDRGTLLIKLPRPPETTPARGSALSIADDVFEKTWAHGPDLAEPLEGFVAHRANARRPSSPDPEPRRGWRIRLIETMEQAGQCFRNVREIWRA